MLNFARSCGQISHFATAVHSVLKPVNDNASDILMENTWQIFGHLHYHLGQLDEKYVVVVISGADL